MQLYSKERENGDDRRSRKEPAGSLSPGEWDKGWGAGQRKGVKKMIDFELGAIQERFADIVWANEPVGSGDLVRICEKEFGWKKPTTYTVLRKLCEKGLLVNDNGTVTSLVSKEEFYSSRSRQIVDESFAGSLPAFVAAFVSKKKLTAKEVDEIQKMIDEFRENGEK